MSVRQDEMIVQQPAGGILIRAKNLPDIALARQCFFEKSASLGIEQLIETITENDGLSVRFRMRKDLKIECSPFYDTLQLCDVFRLDPQTNPADIGKEIVLSMLLGPVTFEYPNYAELAASLRIRHNIVVAASRTALAFHTSKIERPIDYWTYSEDCGFTVLPGKPLIEALRKATQPEVSGEKYCFSCYRATEYVILLGIAQELEICNPVLLQQLQQQWEFRSIKSRQFHDVFLREFGSMSEPLPPRYFVPGDRLWFRNPDERSSDVTGYEGSWVFYLGGGLFTNFWERDKPYTLTSKCIEIYHWRHGVCQDSEGNLHIDETIVQKRVSASMQNQDEIGRILEQMLRLRDVQGVYADGGCIDTSREYPRCVCPVSADLILPID
jgi:hypothetical protein